MLVLIETMPAPRREELTRRFVAASDALTQAGLRNRLLDPGQRTGLSDRDLSTAYFALGIACPFLEEESCSIHADRPLVCREYLVTSPAELCAGSAQEGVTPVPVPKTSLAARGLDEAARRGRHVGAMVSARLAAGVAQGPAASAHRPAGRGPEWVEQFLKRVGR